MTSIEIIETKVERLESLVEQQSYELEGIRKLIMRSKELDVDEAQDALENIEQEILARACRNGVCED